MAKLSVILFILITSIALAISVSAHTYDAATTNSTPNSIIFTTANNTSSTPSGISTCTNTDPLLAIGTTPNISEPETPTELDYRYFILSGGGVVVLFILLFLIILCAWIRRRKKSQIKETHCGHDNSASENQAYQLDQCPAYGKFSKPTSNIGHSCRPTEEYQLNQCQAYGELVNTAAHDETVYYSVCR